MTLVAVPNPFIQLFNPFIQPIFIFIYIKPPLVVHDALLDPCPYPYVKIICVSIDWLLLAPQHSQHSMWLKKMVKYRPSQPQLGTGTILNIL